MQVTLFGGAFDPPHLGHQTVTNELIERGIADEVWYVPVKQHPFQKNLNASDEDRLAMLAAMLTNQTRIEMYELEHSQISYAYHTLRGLSAQYPQHTFSWVIGSDNLGSFTKWGFYEKLLQEFVVYVYPRENYPMEPILPGMTPLTEMLAVAVSSTQVRDLVKQHQAIDGLVHPTVAAYIAQHQLYL